MDTNRPTSDPTRPPAASTRPRRLRLALAGALVTGLLALGAVAAARGPFGFGSGDPELAREHAEFMVERTLTRVDATPDQVEKVQAIVGEALDDLFALREAHQGLRAEMVAVLTAEQIDRDKLESLRQEQVAGVDAATKRMLTAIADAGEVLTPRQRAAVAEHIAERRERHHRRWRD